jgi:hypothetical protein
VLLRRRLSLVIAVALMLGMLMFTAFGPVSEKGIAPHLVEAAPTVQVNVNCTSNPETTAVKNTNRIIRVAKVGSIYQPRPNEPFVVNRMLKPGKSITFKSGTKAVANSPLTLTRQHIYENDVGRQGERESPPP